MGFMLKYILGPVLAAVVGRGVLEGLHLMGWYPDLWVASLFVEVPSRANIETAIWGISACLGLALYALERRFHLIDHLVGRSSLQPASVISSKKEALVISEIASLDWKERQALRGIIETGSVKGITDIWPKLEAKTSFMHRNFIGPQGIKSDFLPIIESILNKDDLPRNRLGVLLDDGLKLLNRTVRTDDEFSRWQKDFSEWTEAVYSEITETFGEGVARTVRAVGSIIAADFPPSYNPSHNHLKLCLDKLIENLKMFIHNQTK
jgi:hypothetical protein